MKLKTLKDFDACGTCLTEHSCDCPNWDKGKHLEDCEIKGWCIFNALRQEAIKWVKHFNSNNGDFVKTDDWDKFTDSGYDEYASHAYGNVISWIKHFFNITEEDLK